MKIEIKYTVDSSNFSDQDFENEPERIFVIDENILSNILRSYADLKSCEILHEFEVKTIQP